MFYEPYIFRNIFLKHCVVPKMFETFKVSMTTFPSFPTTHFLLPLSALLSLSKHCLLPLPKGEEPPLGRLHAAQTHV